jgi:hypothetical protein
MWDVNDASVAGFGQHLHRQIALTFGIMPSEKSSHA